MNARINLSKNKQGGGTIRKNKGNKNVFDFREKKSKEQWLVLL